MSTQAETLIWGKPLFERHEDWSVSRRRPDSDGQSIKCHLRTFLSDQIESFRPDLIVVHERKGTAIVRALIESASSPLPWEWERVVSSTALDQVRPETLAKKRILVFDDMIKTGRHIAEVLESLATTLAGAECDVRVAIFAMHEEAVLASCMAGLEISHAWFYRSLCDRAYQRLRADVIRMLQEAGSLMLDTEHIEVRLTLNASFTKLVDALRRRANVTVFKSLGQRTNLTVCYGEDQAHELDPSRFPCGVSFTDIVKKCRVVQRDGNEFAIIPICLPSVPAECSDWPIQDEDARILGESCRRSDEARFYGTALIGSLYPLFWILRDLYASDPESFTVTLPGHPSGPVRDGGYSLDHLTVMYPTLNVVKLVEHVATVHRRARSSGTELRRIKAHPKQTPHMADSDLHQNALHLLQAIAHLLDTRRAFEESNGFSDRSDRNSQTGLTAGEIFDLGKRFRWHQAHTSALFDILIDDGNLVTRVEKRLDGGVLRWTRTFKPDGEVVSDMIRRYTVQWGLFHAL